MFELALATFTGFKSKHDDHIDTISMIAELNAWKPSEVATYEEQEDPLQNSAMWGDDNTNKGTGDSSYFV